MFNVYLPKLLEKRLGVVESGGKQRVLWDVVIFTLGGCPGALVCRNVFSQCNAAIDLHSIAWGMDD